MRKDCLTPKPCCMERRSPGAIPIEWRSDHGIDPLPGQRPGIGRGLCLPEAGADAAAVREGSVRVPQVGDGSDGLRPDEAAADRRGPTPAARRSRPWRGRWGGRRSGRGRHRRGCWQGCGRRRRGGCHGGRDEAGTTEPAGRPGSATGPGAIPGGPGGVRQGLFCVPGGPRLPGPLSRTLEPGRCVKGGPARRWIRSGDFPARIGREFS